MRALFLILTLSLALEGLVVGAPLGCPQRNRIGLSFKATFNIEAEFIDNGTEISASNPGLADGRGDVNRTYDNPGSNYVLVDITGNRHFTSPTNYIVGTWGWGFSDLSQVSGDNLVMTSTSATAIGSTTESDDPYFGAEFTYSRELVVRKNVHFGLEGAFGFFNVTIHDTDPVPGRTTVTTDVFNLNGYVPSVPDQNPTNRPGPIISSTVTGTNRTVTTTQGTAVEGFRTVNANVYGLRLGPYVDVDFGDDWYLTLSGGIAVAAIDNHLEVSESLPSSYGDSAREGRDGRLDWTMGGYVAASMNYRLTDRVSVFAGAQYHVLGDLERDVADKTMILHLGGTVSGVAGISYTF